MWGNSWLSISNMRKKDNHRFCTQTIRHINSSLIHFFLFFTIFLYGIFYIQFRSNLFYSSDFIWQIQSFCFIISAIFRLFFFVIRNSLKLLILRDVSELCPSVLLVFFLRELMNSFKSFSAQSTKVHFVVVYHINNNAIGGGCHGLSLLIEQSIFHLIVL